MADIMSNSSPKDIPEEPLLLIGVMGVTGSGKSTFVKSATGDESVGVGHTLEACRETANGPR